MKKGLLLKVGGGFLAVALIGGALSDGKSDDVTNNLNEDKQTQKSEVEDKVRKEKKEKERKRKQEAENKAKEEVARKEAGGKRKRKLRGKRLRDKKCCVSRKLRVRRKSSSNKPYSNSSNRLPRKHITLTALKLGLLELPSFIKGSPDTAWLWI